MGRIKFLHQMPDDRELTAIFDCEQEEEDPALKQIQVAIRVEMALLEKMILDKMIAGLKTDGEVPQLSVLPEGAVSPETPKRTINIRV